MFEFSLSKTDKVLLVCSVCAAAVAAALLADSQLLSSSSPTSNDEDLLQPAGQVVAAQNDVRRKSARSMVWSVLTPNTKVYFDDSIYSGEESEITIAIQSGSKLRLEPNSLVLLGKTDSHFTLDLQLGGLSTELQKGEQLALKDNGVVTPLVSDVDGTKLRVGKDAAERTLVAVDKGRVKARVGKSETLIHDKQQFHPTNELHERGSDAKVEVETIPIELKSPLLDETVWLSSDKSLSLEWDAAGAGEPSPSSGAFRVEISPRRDFSNPVLTETTTNSALKTDQHFKNGRYYWRVSSSGGRLTATGSFRVMNLVPPKTWFPNDKMTYAQTELEFSWEPMSAIKNYRLQVAKDEQFTKLAVDQVVNDARAQLSLSEAGRYFWRVRVEDESPLREFWSASRSLRYIPPKPTPTPLPESPLEPEAETVARQGFSAMFAPIISRVFGGSEDQPQMTAKTAETNEKPAAAKLETPPTASPEPTVEIRPTPQSESQAAVLAATPADAQVPDATPEIPATPTATVTPTPMPTETPTATPAPSPPPAKVVRLSAPVLQSAKISQTLEWNYKERSFGRAVQLAWKAVPSATAYSIVITEDLDAKKIVSQTKTRDSRLVWSKPHPGHFYWFVSALSGSLHSDEAMGELELSLAPPRLEALIKTKCELANAKCRPVDITLGEPPLAVIYQIEVAETAQFDGAKSFQTDTSHASLAGLHTGRLFVRTRFAAASDHTPLSGYSKSAELQIEQNIHLLAPRLLMPENDAQLVQFGSSQTTIFFQWESATDAKEYVLQISPTEDFSTISLEQKTPKPSYLLRSELKASALYWRVRARAQDIQSEWSPARRLLLK